MKRFLLAALVTLAFAAPASAQYYGSPYSPPFGEDSSRFEEEWDEPAPRRWEERRGLRRPEYGYRPQREDRFESRRDFGYGPPPGAWREGRRPARRAQAGNVCVTSRGSCEYPQYFPLNTRCRCDIPGFGMKRGNILE